MKAITMADGEKDISLPEALAMLESRPYEKRHATLGERVIRLREWALGKESMFALTTATAVTVLAMFIYAKRTREWFIMYGMQGGMPTVVVGELLLESISDAIRILSDSVCFQPLHRHLVRAP